MQGHAHRQELSVQARYLWKISPRGQWNTHFGCFHTSKWAKDWALRSVYICPAYCLFQCSSIHESERHPTQREAGCSLLQSRRALRAPFWDAVYGVAREWALAIPMFHPGHSLGPCFLWKCENRNITSFRQEEYFPTLVIRTAAAC